MNTPSQTARWPSDTALWGAMQVAASSAPGAAGVATANVAAANVAAAWPAVAGLAPLQVIEALAVLRASLAAGPALDEAAERLRAALDAPAGGASPVEGGIDLAPFQALLDEFRAAEQVPGGLPSLLSLSVLLSMPVLPVLPSRSRLLPGPTSLRRLR